MTARRKKARVAVTHRKSKIERKLGGFVRSIKRNLFWIGLGIGAVVVVVVR